MPTPEIPFKNPAVLELTPGTYWWCACGRSADQPWCDGSHEGTEFEPVIFKIEEPRKVAMCRCKHSAKIQFCDGTHKTL